MLAAKEIPSDHKDLIHDVAFDFHGRRMATCSSDQTVKVHLLIYASDNANVVYAIPPCLYTFLNSW